MAEKLVTFSSRSNAKRAAEKAIATGTAPSIDYGVRSYFGDGYPSGTERFEIVWHREDAIHGRRELPEPEGAEAAVEEMKEHFDAWESEANAMDPFAHIEAPDTDNHVDKEEIADDHKEESETEVSMPDRFPPGARVIVQLGARKKRTGAVEYRVDATSCRVKFDGPMPSVLCRYNQMTLDDGSAPIQAPVKAERKPRAAPSGDRKPSRSAELDARAATGAMPTKPIMTSPTNREQYQKRFDQLEKWAMAGDWDAVQKYEVKGINSYAKMVKQYRDRLLAAHAASASDEAA